MARTRLPFLLLLGGIVLPQVDAQEPFYRERWLYVSTNLLVDENVARTTALMDRAAASEYTAIQLNDYKWNFLERMPERYFRNVQKVREKAQQLNLEIIPAVFPIGYSGGLLSHDPNLAEGLPAELVLEVRSGIAEPLSGTDQLLRNGDLEGTRGEHGQLFAEFASQDEPGLATFADREVHRDTGSVSCRMEIGSEARKDPNSRLIQTVLVQPRTCYRLSAWIKTRDFGPIGSFRLLAIGASDQGQVLTFHEGDVDATQDWKPVEVNFNSLENEKINVYVGVWGQGQGTLWVDDLQLEQVPLVNVLRRPGCPLKVTSLDGRTTYEEGRDFEPIVDSKLGQIPYAGEFEFGHEPPTVRIPAGSRLQKGDQIRVHWYHPVITHGFQVASCLSEPKVYELLRDQARRVHELFRPRTFFMSHDELRVANWCHACQSRGLSAGQLLAYNARQCVDILAQVAPEAGVAVWSDMFDPHHNARDGYYLVRGSLEGAWKGLDPSVIIVNWNSGQAEKSLRFFADRGHPQVIAGYYDSKGIENFNRWTQSARGVPGIFGFMYTTWNQDYDLLEKYGREALTP